uniref:Transmembrane protein n=1 Tax=Daphnia galeata TaxID=27404 RepID=A0A8J2S9K3_9CRUS|nr:unnamed protein product [Daphnia galeata]
MAALIQLNPSICTKYSARNTLHVYYYYHVNLLQRRKRMLGSISGTVFLFSSFLILVVARHYRSTLM